MKRILSLLSVVAIALTLTACKGDKVNYDGIDTDVVGQIDILQWGGSNVFMEDIGHQNYTPEQLTTRNDASAYYAAKEFNKIYPNVTINLLSKPGGPSWNWGQELENYKAENGAHPSIWAARYLTEDVQKGIVADLSRFEDDPLYQTINPTILEMMNFHGFQAGLPHYILPWGIYVNKELAEDQNLDVPDYDWTIDEYTDFVQNSEEDVYYGNNQPAIRLIYTGVNTIAKTMFNYDGSSPHVDLNSNEVRSLIPYISEWSDDSVSGSEPSPEFVSENGNGWPYAYFTNGKLLTYEYDPWMMSDCANPDEEASSRCTSSDWDIYPRPSTDYVDNTIGIVLDPMAVYNYCLEDGDLACSEEEELKIKISYSFASFWIASDDSWEARAEGTWINETTGAESNSLSSSLPVTIGDNFETQMELWYSTPEHQRFSTAAVMPGFHEVLRIYEAGQFWVVSDKSYPLSVDVEGTTVSNLAEWNGYAYETEFARGDAGFTDAILGSLAEWNTLSNERFKESFLDLEEALKIYYGYTDEDFE